MTHCCSQCSFTSQFESALLMHHQLHHETSGSKPLTAKSSNGSLKTSRENERKSPRCSSPDSVFSKYSKGMKLPQRTSSATRLFDKLRTRICRSKTLFAHPEESKDTFINTTLSDLNANDMSMDITSDCTSKDLKMEFSRISTITVDKDFKETFSCHLCNFDADRITALDRHLLNDHKISLENLLQLVMTKTKQGLADSPGPAVAGTRRPYYRNLVEVTEEGEFILETVSPKVKILKHASTNTDLKWTDIPNLKDNCRMISNELEKLMSDSTENYNKDDFLSKMQTLNECMCKFMDSSKTLKKTLTKEFVSKNSARDRLCLDQPFFNLNFTGRDTAREWERPRSEKMERFKSEYGNKSRGDMKLVAESFYF